MKCSIVIANRNDTIMLSVTVRSALEELTELGEGQGEIIICDNSDPEEKKALGRLVPSRYIKFGQVKIIHQDFNCLFTARESAIKEASGEYVLCVDSHMIFGHNTIKNAVEFMDRNKTKKIGFGHIPCGFLTQHSHWSKHDMAEIHGTWGNLYNYERRISWKGMPWICRKDWFLNTLNGYGALSEHKLAWGGGDMYLGLKTWQIVYENWAIPCRAIIHMGPFPPELSKFQKYRVYSDSGSEKAWIGFIVALLAMDAELYLEDEAFTGFLEYGKRVDVKGNLERARELSVNDKKWFDENRTMTFAELAKNLPWEKLFYTDIRNLWKAYFNIQKIMREEDWDVIKGITKEYDVKTVLEFGCGISTKLLSETQIAVETYETDKAYMAMVGSLCNGRVTFNHWNNDQIQPVRMKDMGIVDGIMPRIPQMLMAKKYCKIVIVHDSKGGIIAKNCRDIFGDWTEIKNETRRTRVFVKDDKQKNKD